MTSNGMIYKKIAWLVPYPIQGSGGHNTIFRHIKHLTQEYECHIILQNEDYAGNHISSVSDARSIIQGFYNIDVDQVTIHLGLEVSPLDVHFYDLVVATAWFTASITKQFNNPSTKKAYFIQDYEAMFNPVGDTYIEAENSYSLGLVHITIGNWLRHRLSSYSNFCYSFPFSIDPQIYYPQFINKDNAKRVCFIYQPEKPRRCSHLGIKALSILKSIDPSIEIFLYGSHPNASQDVCFPHTNLGIITPKQCNHLYNICHAGLCISTTNPSRIPFEMMACGLPVVDVHRSNNLYDLPDQCVTLARQTPESIAFALHQILSDKSRNIALSNNSINYMKEFPEHKAMDTFLEIIHKIINNDLSPISSPIKVYNSSPVLAPHQFLSNIPDVMSLYKTIEKLNSDLKLKDEIISNMKSSKFWKVKQIINSLQLRRN